MNFLYETISKPYGRYDLFRLQNDSTRSPQSAIYPFWYTSMQMKALWKYIREHHYVPKDFIYLNYYNLAGYLYSARNEFMTYGTTYHWRDGLWMIAPVLLVTARAFYKNDCLNSSLKTILKISKN